MKYTKNGKEIELFFLSDEDIDSSDYRKFINSDEFRKFMRCPDDDLHAIRKKKIEYYKSLYDFKILCVRVDGVIVGQSCALKNYAMANGEKVDWWWSVDTYLMSACRGLGVGKNLQKVLHDSLPNFSSAWYTPINGIVKQKCGAHGIFDIWFNYYPVSSAITVFGDLCFRKLFKCPIPLRLSATRFYSWLNGLFIDSKLKNYVITEIPYEELDDSVSAFMESQLLKKDFHIIRSTNFLKWKYNSLKAGYHMLRFEKDGRTAAIISFSNIYVSGFDAVPINGVTIYDHVIADDCNITLKQLLLYVVRWYKVRNEKFDGFQMLERISYISRMCYPFHACPVLTTLKGNYPNSYLTFIDQDMDQV